VRRSWESIVARGGPCRGRQQAGRASGLQRRPCRGTGSVWAEDAWRQCQFGGELTLAVDTGSPGSRTSLSSHLTSGISKCLLQGGNRRACRSCLSLRGHAVEVPWQVLPGSLSRPSISPIRKRLDGPSHVRRVACRAPQSRRQGAAEVGARAPRFEVVDHVLPCRAWS